MKISIKKIYIILFLTSILLISTKVYAKESEERYTRENISNYFLGIVYANKEYNQEAFDHLSKVQSLKDKHFKFNIEFIRTLVLLDKFDKAISYSKKVWDEDELFFEADLLLGLNYFLKEDYSNSEKHFERLNNISTYNFFFKDFIGNILLSWNKASQGDKEDSLKFLNKIPDPYKHIVKIQKSFNQCYFSNENAQDSFEKLTGDDQYNFSRYNFFLTNYLLHLNRNVEAKQIIKEARKKYNSNILLRQSEVFLSNDEDKKIKDFFDCKNSKDVVAEFFYILANLYASEKDYQLSNFYLKISLFLNNKFLSNKALLAENFYFQERNKLSKNVHNSIKSIGTIYSWYASKSIATIILEEEGAEHAINVLKKDFDLIPNLNFEHYYDLANFYKENEYYEESIKYYTLSLKNLKKDHFLIPKILDRRGTSYERIGDWEKAEKDLTQSLKILPNQAHVLNYLAYTWVDKGINLEKGLEMLIKATELRVNDGYIIDSLGWAYYAKKNYIKAESFLQRAVELLPLDPIINDHYADALWMLNKDIQARYVWKYILNLSNTEKELKDKINNKLIFGISKKL